MADSSTGEQGGVHDGESVHQDRQHIRGEKGFFVEVTLDNRIYCSPR